MRALRRLCSTVSAWRHSGTITVAVTGLSKAGKTAFITSTLANLCSAPLNSRAADWLVGFEAFANGRILSAAIPRNFRPTHGRQLDFNQMLKALTADTPSWPARTANVYETAIDIYFWTGNRPEPEVAADTTAARLRLVLVDYPGEWLVDVPMVDQSYVEWSAAALDRLDRAPWSEIAGDFRHVLKRTDWVGADDNDAAKRGARAWQGVLVAARKRGLKWLQPAHFVRARGEDEEADVPRLDEERLWFCPMPAEAIRNARTNSLARAMSDRYGRYQKEVKKFFGDTLRVRLESHVQRAMRRSRMMAEAA